MFRAHKRIVFPVSGIYNTMAKFTMPLECYKSCSDGYCFINKMRQAILVLIGYLE
jgi:hypothetical protein